MRDKNRSPEFDELWQAIREASMRSFIAECDAELEFESPLNKPDFEYWWVVHPSGSLRVGAAVVSFSEDGRGIHLRVENVRAVDPYEAVGVAAAVIETALASISLAIQREYPEQYRGHVRFTWSTSTLRIDPWESPLPGGGAVGKARWLDAAVGEQYARGLSRRPELRLLLFSYYNSLAPLAPIAKFYAAFVVIEYAEKRWGETHPTLLTESKIAALEEHIVMACRSVGLEPAVAARVRRHMLELKSRTLKTRSEKLLTILHDELEIAEIQLQSGGPTPVDASLVKAILHLRNRLVHAPSAEVDESEVKRLSDAAIIVAGAVLHRVLTEAVAESE